MAKGRFFFTCNEDKIACEFEKGADVRTEISGGKRDRDIDRQSVQFVKTYAIFNRARVHRHDRFTQRCIPQNLSPKPTKSKDTFAL
jgi:hypothetical protein